MSLRVMNLVWRTSSQKGSSLLVLVALAYQADDEGLAWPRIETLVAWTRLGERYLRRILRRLEADGELAIEPHRSDRRRHAYRLIAYLPSEGATGSPGPPFTGTGDPVSARPHRTPWSGDSRNPASGDHRNAGSPPSEDERRLKPPPNPKNAPGPERVQAVLRIWDGLPPEVERPSPGRIRVWLGEWADDVALLDELRDLRARGYLTISVNYVHACLANARRRGRRPGVASGDRLIAEMQAIAERTPEPPIDVASRLARLADALPLTLPERRLWQARIRRLEGGIEAVEDALGALEKELLSVAEHQLGDGAATLDERVAAALRPHAARLPAAERRTAAASLRRRLLRRHAALPQLSLFSPAAAEQPPFDPDGGGDDG